MGDAEGGRMEPLSGMMCIAGEVGGDLGVWDANLIDLQSSVGGIELEIAAVDS